jgi:hypothetical protein
MPKPRLLLSTSRYPFGWYPIIPTIYPPGVDGIIQVMRWSMAKMILGSPYTLSDIAASIGKSVRAVRMGVTSQRATMEWFGLIAYVTGNEINFALKAKTVWSGGNTYAENRT